MRVLLLSDLHVYTPDGGGSPPSYASTEGRKAGPMSDAFEALKVLVKKESITADAVLCAGDMCNKADAAGVAHAWANLQEVGAIVGATITTAVSGNHDLDSRHIRNQHDPDPKGVLQELSPSFPLGSDALCDKYWSRNYVTTDIEPGKSRLMLLNTSAYHGGVEKEMDHGRIASRTVQSIRRQLDAEGKRSLNILLCHHHLFPHSNLDGTPDYEAVQNGQALLEALDSSVYGPWVVMHGHRHVPRIAFSAGTTGAPLVIGAATFSARNSGAENQVHLIEVSPRNDPHCEIGGSISTWTFSLGMGFVRLPAARNALPAFSGFGYRGNLNHLAKEVAKAVVESSERYLLWEDLVVSSPSISFLTYESLEACVNELKNLGVMVAYDKMGRPLQFMGPAK